MQKFQSHSQSITQDGRGDGERDRNVRMEGERNVEGEGQERVDVGHEGEEEEEVEEEDAKSVMEDLVANYFTSMSRRGSPLVNGSKQFGQDPRRSFSGRHQLRPSSNGHSNGGSSGNSNINSVMTSYINSVINSNMNSVMNSNMNSVMNSNMNSVMNSNMNSVMNSNMNSVMNSVMNSNINSVTNSQEYGVTSTASDNRWAKQSIVLSKSSTPRPNSPFQHIQLQSPFGRLGAWIGSEWDSQPSPTPVQQGGLPVVAFTQPESKTSKNFTTSAPPHGPLFLTNPFQTEKWSPMVQLSLSPMPVSPLSSFLHPSCLLLLVSSYPSSLPLICFHLTLTSYLQFALFNAAFNLEAWTPSERK